MSRWPERTPRGRDVVANVVERHPHGTSGVVFRANLAQELTVAIEEAHRSSIPSAVAERGRERRERSAHDEPEDRREHHAAQGARNADETRRRGGLSVDPPEERAEAGLHRAFTSKVAAAVRPNDSGSYMHSARVGGTTKRPGVVARAR
jgi:hypothetical protein